MALGVLLVIATLIRVLNYKGWERFYYASSVCAPGSYPVYIRELYFILPGKEMASFNDDDVKSFMSEWGKEHYFPEAYEKDRLPLKLVVNYASYREQKFYNDTLDLDQQLLLETFRAAPKKDQEVELYDNKHGLTFLAGLANDGQFILWLRGKNLEKVILKARLAAREPTADDTYINGGRVTKKQYLTTAFEDLNDSLKTVFKNGFDAGANYIDTPTHYIRDNERFWKAGVNDPK
ncbi:Protein of unknown function (DUF2931) [Pedobacter metabolipauper]|uniref:DUF2931 family protein n=2 Tax=Pedobacter metabolipauper TaxID=425513 RepID=A0A4R6SW24_9SPHI|nr:Protein of unknown function (DUF2931) [Pedobacter metabolipauper]